MKTQIKTALALITTSMMLMPGAFAAPSAQSTTDKVTDARTEMMQFAQNLAQSKDALAAGNVDQAFTQANAAKSWFLAFADSVALEKPGISWDQVRQLESSLLTNYQEVAQKLHQQGEFAKEQQVLQTALLVNPMQGELNEQLAQAEKAQQDANDVD